MLNVSETDCLHPCVDAVEPVADVVVGGVAAESVVYLGVDVHLRRNIHRAKLLVNEDGAHGGVDVVVAMDQAHRGRFFVEGEVVDHLGVVAFSGVRTVGAVFKNVRGIDGSGEIDVARDLVDVVDRIVGVGEARC